MLAMRIWLVDAIDETTVVATFHLPITLIEHTLVRLLGSAKIYCGQSSFAFVTSSSR